MSYVSVYLGRQWCGGTVRGKRPRQYGYVWLTLHSPHLNGLKEGRWLAFISITLQLGGGRKGRIEGRDGGRIYQKPPELPNPRYIVAV